MNSIDALLPDNTSGDITAANVRAAFEVIIGAVGSTFASTQYVDSVIINTFTGTAEPANSLGKENDIYKRYPGDSPTVVMDGASVENYDADDLFEVFFNLGADDLWQVKVMASLGIVLLKYGSDGTPDQHDYTMQIGNGVVHDMYLYSSNSQAITLKYPVAANAEIASITTATNIKISSKALSGQFQDYTKYDGEWFPTIPYSRVEVDKEFDTDVPTSLELVIAFGMADHHDFKHNHKFYVKNSHGLYVITYRANGDVDISGTNYRLYWEKLVESV